MATTLAKEYDTKVDSKRRVTLRETSYQFYHVREFESGKIELSPRVLVDPFTISKNTLAGMDKAIENIKKGKRSKPIDLSKF